MWRVHHRYTALLKQEGALTNSVLAKDRPLALVDSSYQQKPAQPVLHDFMRGVFIPDNWGKWEFKRFKDNEDPEIDLEKSLYIGDSIGTKDENQKDEETQEITSASDLQKGEEYEKNPSSALIFERGVGVHLVSSTKKEDSKISRARVSLKGNVIESFVEDTENDVKIKTEIGYENGFYIEQKYKDSKFKLKNKDGKLSIETNGKDWEADVLLEKGTLKIETKGRIIVDSSRGGLNINTGKSTTIKAEKANVITEGNINVISKGGVSIKSTSTIALETLNKIDIGAIGSIKLKSGSDMRFLGTTGFHAGRKIEIEGKDKISYSSRYYGLSLSSRELEIIGGSSSIKCLEETIEIKTPKNILAEAKFSSITLQSQDCIAMPNFHLETLPDFQKGSFDGVGAWVPKNKDE